MIYVYVYSSCFIIIFIKMVYKYGVYIIFTNPNSPNGCRPLAAEGSRRSRADASKAAALGIWEEGWMPSRLHWHHLEIASEGKNLQLSKRYLTIKNIWHGPLFPHELHLFRRRKRLSFQMMGPFDRAGKLQKTTTIGGFQGLPACPKPLTACVPFPAVWRIMTHNSL